MASEFGPKTYPVSHSELVLHEWQRLDDSLMRNNEPIFLNGRCLDISQVVSVARYASRTSIDPLAYRSLLASLEALQTRLEGGAIIYGVNTGFGGTADVRTQKTQQLQRVLIRELHYGILASGSRDHPLEKFRDSISQHQYDLSLEHIPESTHLPWTWTRGAILIRINSLIKGYSGIRPVVVDRMQDLLTFNIIPMIPLRGSISASGDLSPLSYIGGAIQGKPTIRILSKEKKVYADEAFSKARLEPVSLEAKEGLAIVNGTAISTAAGALALHDANGLLLLSQILTAMSVEALAGTAESFHPFFAEARPHPGQVESARNILNFLEGSKLVKVNNGTEASLRQDRYSIRTAPQWIGPILEDFVLAHQQIDIECNSATDNPLVNLEGDFLHGGNFQAKAVTAAMEKVRQGVQGIGRMLFTQCTEMINPATSRGLPPNLVAEDPSTSYIFKGSDLSIAALQAELGFLSNPVNHVQTAEMGNQSLNSLALISARYTHMSIDVLSQLMAAHLLSVCQALDIRAMQAQFFENFRPQFEKIVGDLYTLDKDTNDIAAARPDANALKKLLWTHLLTSFDGTVSMDASERFPFIAKSLRNVFFDHSDLENGSGSNSLKKMADFTRVFSTSLHDNWIQHREAYFLHGDATPILGRASKHVYTFIRKSLRVPFLFTSRLTTPTNEEFNGGPIGNENHPIAEKEAPTVGSYNGAIYRALLDGTLVKVAIDVLREVK